jgi:hypothetical protein
MRQNVEADGRNATVDSSDSGSRDYDFRCRVFIFLRHPAA